MMSFHSPIYRRSLRYAIAIFTIAIVQQFGVTTGNAQVWNRMPWAMFGNNPEAIRGGYVDQYFSHTWAFDRNRTCISVATGSNVLCSTDSGTSWRSLRLPIERTTYGLLSASITENRTLILQSKDVVSPGLNWVIVTNDLGATWDSVRVSGQFYVNCDLPLRIVHESFVMFQYVRYPEMITLISTDEGRSWRDSVVSNVHDSVSQTGKASASIAYCTDGTGSNEWSMTTGIRSHRSLPKGTYWYRLLGSHNILAQRRVRVDSSSLTLSIDGGASWMTIDTMRFENSDLLVVPDVLDEIRRDNDSLAATFLFRSGIIVSTTDGGVHWYFRGRTTRWSDVCNETTTLGKGPTLLPHDYEGYDILPSGWNGSVQSLASAPVGVPLQVTDSIVLLASKNTLYKSHDNGLSWFVMGDEITPTAIHSSNGDPGLHSYSAKQLFWGSDDRLWSTLLFQTFIVNGSSTRNRFSSQLVLSYTHPRSNEQRWFYRGLQDFDPIAPIREDGVLQSKDATSTPIAARVLRATDVYPNIETIEIVPHLDSTTRRLARTGAYFVWQTRSGEIIVVADSLLRSADTGRTWRAFPSTGFPIDSAGTKITATSFCEGPRGEWYVGTSGIIVVDSAGNADSSAQGGVLRSVDQGATWHRIAGFPASAHVMHLVCDAYGNTFASVTERMRDLTKSELLWESDYGASVYRITNDVASEVFTEFYSGPAISFGRVLRRDHAENILYASIAQGLLRSTDAGTSWHALGTTTLDTLRVLDIVVDSNDRVYVGTDNGVYYADVALGVDVEDDNASRRTSVWCYPTPTSSVLRVRVNNIDLITTESPRLTISTLLGEHVLDLTDELMKDRSSKRMEFDVDLSTLPRGVYGLLLWAGTSSSMQKVLIAR